MLTRARAIPGAPADAASAQSAFLHCPSFIETVRRNAAKADATAFVFLKNGETAEATLTFAALDRKARALATLLQQRLALGDRALLLFPWGPEFIVAFLACLYAGVVAVPVNLPRRQQSLEKLSGIVSNCDAKLILTDEATLQGFNLGLSAIPRLSVLPLVTVDKAIGDASAQLAPGWQSPVLDHSSIAFLQYTSGSTGRPKGVAITHGNLLANQTMITAAFGHGPHTIFAGWLPFHHDMGLVGNILHPLYLGNPCVLMSPAAFSQQPVRWLQAISRYRATTSGAPNFAYELCLRRVSPEQTQGLDLSSWEVAFSGAEPVRAATLRRFSEKFATAGFSSKAFYPCYGMAEATLFACGPLPGRGATLLDVSAEALEKNCAEPPAETAAEDARTTLVGCGAPPHGEQLLIVDPETNLACGDRTVGEIWLRGPNIAGGYWNDEEANREAFRGYLATSREGPFLRTGDLGFIAGGELYVTGRSKELIIFHGRNLYPHDLEDCVAKCHPALDGCLGAAFSLDADGEEKLIVVHEVAQRRLSAAEYEAIETSTRKALVLNFDVHLQELKLVIQGAIPRTSSGKRQRNLCRTLYRQGQLPCVEVRQ